VIVNFKTTELAVECLHSIAPEVSVLPSARVVVVDNGSGDGSVERIRRALQDQRWTEWASVLALESNEGFAAGNNAAIRPLLEATDRHQHPEYVFLLNPDTRVRPGALAALVEFMDSHPAAGIGGSRLESPDGSPQHSSHRFHTLWSEAEAGMRLGILSRLLRRILVSPPLQSFDHATDWVCGAAMVVRRRVFDEIGLLDPGYFLYYEEVDFCLRARKAGWECWYVPESRVVHLEGQSTGITGASHVPQVRRPRYWFASRRRYFEKHHGLAYALLADVLWAMGFALWRVRRVLQGKPDNDPPHMLVDFLRFSFRPSQIAP
jgi:GT2 family glycosyltransferase